MAVTPARARTLALSLEGASSYPHFDRIAFRIPQRTFATLALDGSDLNLLFDLEQQQHFCELAPLAIRPVAGGWGRMGWTRCDLTQIDAATFTVALKAAHARASAPRTRRGRTSPASPSSSAARKIAPAKEPANEKASRKKASKMKPSRKKAPTKRGAGPRRP
jgi:hypothetical protein